MSCAAAPDGAVALVLDSCGKAALRRGSPAIGFATALQASYGIAVEIDGMTRRFSLSGELLEKALETGA